MTCHKRKQFYFVQFFALFPLSEVKKNISFEIV